MLLTGSAGAQTNLVFPDANLERAIRSALSQPTGLIASRDLEKLISLSAPDRNISNLSGLEYATNLTGLYLTGNDIVTLTPLKNLNQLHRLFLDHNQISDLTPLAGLGHLTDLNVGNNRVADGTALSGLTNLACLYLYDNSIRDLTFVESLDQLRSLGLENNQIEQPEALATLKNLSSLTLGGNPIHDYSALSSLSRLKALSICEGSVENMNDLQHLNLLTVLDLHRNQISDLSPLAELTNLSRLDLSWNRVTNFAVLANAAHLKCLRLAGDAISDATFLQGSHELQLLNLAGNQITDLSPLSALQNLTCLVLTRNPVTNLQELSSGLTNLTILELSGVPIPNLNFAPFLGRLKSLDLAETSAGDVSALATLSRLESLVLNGTPIINYQWLPQLAGLKNLWLDGHTNVDWNALESLTSLQTVSLRKCQWNDLNVLAGFTNLTSLYADYNRLKNITALDNFPKLCRAGLIGNLLDTNAEAEAVSVIENLSGRGVSVSYLPQSQPPVIVVPAQWYMGWNTSSSISILVTSSLGDGDPLSVTCYSENPALLPQNGAEISGTGAQRTLTLKPSSNALGEGIVVVTATNDAGLTNSVRISVNVLQPMSVTNLLSSGSMDLDANLESAFRWGSGNYSTGLTTVDLLRVAYLDAYDVGVDTFDGWQWLSNTVSLNLVVGSTSDVSFVTNLPQITSLTIHDTAVTNLAPLAALTNLTSLHLNGKDIEDISFLTGATRLQFLDINWTSMDDLSPLAGLTNLSVLNCNYNPVTNILVLDHLPALTQVDARFNRLDTVSDPVALTVIEDLLARGVAVEYEPQRALPAVDLPDQWNVRADQPSALSFNISDDSAPAEFARFEPGVHSFVERLLGDTNVAVGVDTNGVIPEWMLAVKPNSGQPGVVPVQLSITNDMGMVTNKTITVTLVLPQVLDDDFFGTADIAWTNGGDAGWFGQSTVSFNGLPAAQSANIWHGETSTLEARLVGPGTLRFWWKVSSEEGADYLMFESSLLNNQISGEVDWEEQIVPIALGSQIVRWYYIKNDGLSHGMDASWLSGVVFVPATGLFVTGGPTHGECQLDLFGVPGQRYRIEVSTNLVNWTTLATVDCTNRVTALSDPEATNATRFYRAISNVWSSVQPQAAPSKK
jgi:internalin A